MVLRCCDEVRTTFRNLYCRRGDSLKVTALDRIDIQTSITPPHTSLEEAARLSACGHHRILSGKLSIANSELAETVAPLSYVVISEKGINVGKGVKQINIVGIHKNMKSGLLK